MRGTVAHLQTSHKFHTFRDKSAAQSESVYAVTRRSSNPQPILGSALRELRSKRDMTQEAVARSADITVAHLSAIERGLANPTWGAVTAIASALGVSMGELGSLTDKLKD
jgi:DNA-binding XRE family transcriptional regulator